MRSKNGLPVFGIIKKRFVAGMNQLGYWVFSLPGYFYLILNFKNLKSNDFTGLWFEWGEQVYGVS